MVEVKNLGKRFPAADPKAGVFSALKFLWTAASNPQGRWSLADLSFSLEEGCTLGIVGRNGSGKTTLLRLLAGVYQPTTGTIVGAEDICALLDLTGGIKEELSGRENIHTLALLARWSPSEFAAVQDSVYEFSGLGKRLDEPCRTYSAGMLLRLAFAVAVAKRPRILLIDEVFSVGDKTFALKCQEKIASFVRQGTTVLFASHDLDFITRFCQKSLWLEGGKAAAFGLSGRVVGAYRAFLAEHNLSNIEPVAYDGPSKKVSSAFGTLLFSGESGAAAFAAGEAITIEIPLEIEEDKGPLNLGVALKGSNGQLLWGSNTLRENLPLMTHPYPEKVVLELTGGEFQPGEYTLDLCLSDKDENPLFYELDCGHFAVLELEGTGQEGIFRPQHKFTIHSVAKKRRGTLQ